MTTPPQRLAELIAAPDQRQHIVVALEQDLPRLASRLRAASEAVSEPDPQAALVHLAFLRDACERAIAAALESP